MFKKQLQPFKNEQEMGELVRAYLEERDDMDFDNLYTSEYEVLGFLLGTPQWTAFVSLEFIAGFIYNKATAKKLTQYAEPLGIDLTIPYRSTEFLRNLGAFFLSTRPNLSTPASYSIAAMWDINCATKPAILKNETEVLSLWMTDIISEVQRYELIVQTDVPLDKDYTELVEENIKDNINLLNFYIERRGLAV